MLKVSSINWGPKPFRVLNCWLDHKDFEKFLSEKWADLEVDGSRCFILKEKLKRLKGELKSWNKETFGKIEDNIQKAVLEIKTLDDRVERGSFMEGHILNRKQLFESFWKLSRMQ